MILKALRNAFKDLTSLQILLMLVLPPIILSAAWIAVVVWNWQWVTAMVESFFKNAEWFKLVLKVAPFLMNDSIFNIVNVISFLALLAGLFPLAFIGSVLIYSLLANPIVFSVVLKKNYPHLSRFPAPFVPGVVHSVLISVLFLVLWILSLPLWLVPGGAIVVPLFLSAFVTKKIYAYDSLSELVNPSERKEIENELSGPYWSAGFLCAGLNFLPFAMFLSPIFAALIFMHLSAAQVTKKDFKI